MPSLTTTILTFSLLLIFGKPAPAQTLSLADCIRLALQRNQRATATARRQETLISEERRQHHENGPIVLWSDSQHPRLGGGPRISHDQKAAAWRRRRLGLSDGG
jgi:hypothetical protein